jgi:hypothetical protein
VIPGCIQFVSMFLGKVWVFDYLDSVSCLSTSYKILTNVFILQLMQFKKKEIIGDYQCRFHHNRLNNDQILHLRNIRKN